MALHLTDAKRYNFQLIPELKQPSQDPSRYFQVKQITNSIKLVQLLGTCNKEHLQQPALLET